MWPRKISHDLNVYQYRKKCGVFGCPNIRFNEKYRYFAIPSKENGTRWILAANNPEFTHLTDQQIRNRFCFCSRHFEDSQYQNALKLRLNRGAMPTVNMPRKENENLSDSFKDTQSSDMLPHQPILVSDDALKEETLEETHPPSLINGDLKNDDTFEEPCLEVELQKGEQKDCKYVFQSVKVYTENGPTEICRTCLKPTSNKMRLTSPTKKRSRLFVNMLKFILPDLNLDVYPNATICKRCEALLAYSYELKKKWLATEETLSKYISKKTFTQRPVNIVIIPDEHKENVIGSRVDENILNKDHNYPQSEIATVQTETDAENCVKISEDRYKNRPKSQFTRDSKHSIEIKKSPTKICQFTDTDNLFDEKFDNYFLCNPTGTALKRKLAKLRKTDWGEAPYLCESCGRIFGELRRYRRHLSNHKLVNTKVDSFTCDICGLTLRNINVRQHYSTHRTKQFTCQICSRQFDQIHLMSAHIKAKHETIKEEYGQCHLCGKRMKRNSMYIHLLTHNPNNRKYECQACNKAFFLNSSLKKHMAAHMEANYRCHLCGKMLKYKHNLKKHIEIRHENKGDYYCNICDRTYWNKYKLKAHVASKHGAIVK